MSCFSYFGGALFIGEISEPKKWDHATDGGKCIKKLIVQDLHIPLEKYKTIRICISLNTF